MTAILIRDLIGSPIVMKTVGMHEARARLSELIDMVRKGKEVTITRRGVPAAKIVPIEEPVPKDKTSIHEAIEEMRKFRAAHPLRGLSIKKMIEEGRL
jgi:prevent-host-death family protein